MNITDQSLTQLENSIRQIPLAERLETAKRMISDMCAEGRPPKMSVPAQATDEDLFIITTLQDVAYVSCLTSLELKIILDYHRPIDPDEPVIPF